jgi:hypothetical protein
MQQYLLSIYQPDGPAPAPATLTHIMHDVNAFMRELEGAGAWVFNGGLCPPSAATVVRWQDGDMPATDGPFIEGKEHIGGFVVVNAADLDRALDWGRKLARATTLPIEVRPFQHSGKE